ncbi:MAG: tubulin/FtsZ family protein [Dehalococcoidales bacterium]|nr:tubulin/FtsZ family protein [Dehalococcoidales bacterium]
MKLLVIGFGQCGGRIADEFARLGIKARLERKINIITGVFAVNTDVADLSGLVTIRPDYQHRVLIGGNKTGGHGVGKINELGAEVARDDGDKIIDALKETPQFAETDAFLLIAGAAGGTGSGAIATITQKLKERYVEKPLYNLIVLPFQHEEETEGRTIYNAATCLKSAYLVADAVFVVDNQRYISKNYSIRGNLSKINSLIAEPFYNLLCAGEETRPQYIGSRILDAGDIIQTLAGWTVIGYSRSQPGRMKNLFDFRDKMAEGQKGVQLINNAISELSVRCNPADAGRGLYLISAPAKDMDMSLVKDIGTHMKRIAPEAIIRTGDYPREKGSLNVTVILSEFSGMKKIVDYFTQTIDLIATIRRKREGIEIEHSDLADAFKDIPSLL